MRLDELEKGLKEVFPIGEDEVWALHLCPQIKAVGTDVVATFRIVEWDRSVEWANSKQQVRLIDNIVEQGIWIKEKHLKDPRFWTALEAATPLLERAMNGLPRTHMTPHHLLRPVWGVLDLKTPKEVWEFDKFLRADSRLGKWI